MIVKITEVTTERALKKLINGSVFTIVGVSGLEEWCNGVNETLKEEGIGKVKEFYTWTGKFFNEACGLQFDPYPEDLNFLAFGFEGLNVPRLSFFRLKVRNSWNAYWLDNLVDNNRKREEELKEERDLDNFDPEAEEREESE